MPTQIYAKHEITDKVGGDSVGQPGSSGLPLLCQLDDKNQSIKTVTVNNISSVPRCAKVLLQGVPAYGKSDSAADMTIMRGDLFKMVASV